MLKKIILVLNLLLIMSFWGLAKADGITASPSTAKVGDKVTIKIKIDSMPTNADKVYLTIFDSADKDYQGTPHLKTAYDASATQQGESASYSYTWDTKAAGSNSGVHNIVVQVYDKDLNVLLDLPTATYTLTAAGADNNNDTQNKTDSKSSSSNFIGTILPPGNSADWTIDDIPTMISNIIKLALALAGGIAVIFILIGAFQYFTAFGNEEKATKGKTTVTYAIIGVVVILLAEVIVYLVRNLIG